LESDLRRALTESELRVAYQPVVELVSRRPVALEALVRWEHPELGLLQPATFLEIAEEAGLDVELGSQVLLRALADIRGLADAGWDLRVNVNVSARQLLTPGFASEVGIALYESGLPGSSLGLEVTETAEVQQSPALLRTLAELKSLEITLLLDDFG